MGSEEKWRQVAEAAVVSCRGVRLNTEILSLWIAYLLHENIDSDKFEAAISFAASSIASHCAYAWHNASHENKFESQLQPELPELPDPEVTAFLKQGANSAFDLRYPRLAQ